MIDKAENQHGTEVPAKFRLPISDTVIVRDTAKLKGEKTRNTKLLSSQSICLVALLATLAFPAFARERFEEAERAPASFGALAQRAHDTRLDPNDKYLKLRHPDLSDAAEKAHEARQASVPGSRKVTSAELSRFARLAHNARLNPGSENRKVTSSKLSNQAERVHGLRLDPEGITNGAMLYCSP